MDTHTHKRTTSLWLAIVIGLANGCGGSVDLVNVGAGAAFEFADDSDPAVKSLAFVETELLVQPYPGAHPRDLAALYSQVGAVVLDELEEIQVTVLGVPAGRLNEIAARVEAGGLIETLSKNYILEANRVPDDALYAQQAYLEQVDAPGAWDESVGDESIIVAVVDSGVDVDHPDLSGKLLEGWNILARNTDVGDEFGHGTHVAGVLAALTDNRTGVAGVSWNSPILPVRVGGVDGSTTARHLAAGILWAVAHDARVINVSYAPLWSNGIVQSAVERAFNNGALVIISSGNRGVTSTTGGYPQALFVGAVDAADVIASFSNRGRFLDLVAPGTAIRSTRLGGDYGVKSGTSFAAPIVAGVAALAWSANPELRPVSIQAALIDTAIDLGQGGKDTVYGHGRIDAAAAVEQALATRYAEDTTPPSLDITRPASGAALSGRFLVVVAADDAPSFGGIADVVLSIDGVPFATDVRAPYRFVIDTSAFAATEHELQAVATDLSGNASSVAAISVTFFISSTTGSTDSLTTIAFTSPAAGASVSGTITIRATVSDEDGLATVEWLIDGAPVFATAVSGEQSGVSFSWRTAGYESGSHVVTIIATDAGGNQTRSDLSLMVR